MSKRFRGCDTLRRVVTEEARKEIKACFRKIGSTASYTGMERNSFAQLGLIYFPKLEREPLV
jgi:hypothetical protein